MGNVAGEDWQNGGGQGFNQSQRYEGVNNRSHPQRRSNQNGHLPRSQGHYHNSNIPPPPPSSTLQRRPAWERNGSGPDTRLPPRPPTYVPRKAPDELNYNSGDGHRGEEVDRGIPPPPRSNPGGTRPPHSAANVDTYIPNYGADSRGVGRDRDRDRDRRDSYDRGDRRSRDRDDRDRYHDRDRDRDRRTRTRSRSPVRERGGGGGGVRDHREREPLSRERDTYRR